jgi:hypothetical protein
MSLDKCCYVLFEERVWLVALALGVASLSVESLLEMLSEFAEERLEYYICAF